MATVSETVVLAKRTPDVGRPSVTRVGVALVGGGQLAALGMGFFTNLLVVRIAHPADVGTYLLLVQSINAVVFLSHLGLDSATLRFLPICRGDGGRETKSLLKILFLSQLVLWSIAAGVVLLVWPTVTTHLNAARLETHAWLVLLAAGCMALNALCDACYRSLRRYRITAVMPDLFTRLLLTTTFGVFWLGGHRDVEWSTLAMAFAAAHALCSLANAMLLPSLRDDFTSTLPAEPVRFARVREVLSTALVMGLRDGVSVLLVASDLWILSWCGVPAAEIAVYGIMVTLMRIVAALPAIANRIVPQEFAVLHQRGQLSELENLARNSSTLVTAAALVIVLALALLGRPLISTVFGDEYTRGYAVLLVLLAGRLFDIACGGAGFLLQMTGHHVKLLGLNLAAAVVNILISIWCASCWGSFGVALGTMVSLILLNIMMVLSVQQLVGVRSYCFFTWREWRGAFRLALGTKG